MAERRRLRTRLLDRVRGPASPGTPAPMSSPAVVPLAPPTHPAPPAAGRVDAAGIFGALQRRMDTLRNTITGVGGEDKVRAGRPDLYRLPLAFGELGSLWRYGGHARRFVEVLPHDATRRGWDLQEGDGEPIDMTGEHKRLELVSQVAEADTWGRLYGGAWIFMVLDEDAGITGEVDLSTPLDLKRVRKVVNLVVLDWSEATPVTFEPSPRNKGYREPSRYRITPQGVTTGDRELLSGQVVHASRMVYFYGAKLPPRMRFANNGMDDSVLQSVWDQIRNVDSLDHSLAALAAEMRITVLKMRDLSDAQVSDEAEYFDYRMRELAKHRSVLNTVLLSDNEEYQHHPGTVAGMGEMVATTRQSLQAVTGMPEQLWIGNAPGGLSTDGESHRNLWANVISSYQTTKLQPALVILYDVIFAAREGPWKGIAPEGWKIKFHPLDELTAAGEADLRFKTAQTDMLYVQMGVLDPQHIAEGRFGEKGWQQDLPPVDQTGLEPADVDMGAVMGALQNLGEEPGATGEEDAAQLSDRQRLAQEMTEAQVRKCEHGSSNRCRICGIERRRGIVLGENGEPSLGDEGEQLWALRWAAIGDYGAGDSSEEEEEAPSLEPLRVLRLAGACVRRARDGTAEILPLPAPGYYDRADQDEDTVSIWIGLPMPRDSLATFNAARFEAATIARVTLEELDMKGRPPHITVLHLGRIPRAESAARAEAASDALDQALSVKDGVAGHQVIELQGTGLGSFDPSPGSDGETPMIMGIDSGALRSLHETLEEQLVKPSDDRPLRWFEAHATLGFFPGELKSQEREELWQSGGGIGNWNADRVQLIVDGIVVKDWQLAERG